MANPAMTEAVYYILISLLSPNHGYGIMQNTEKLSSGRIKLAAGTLYGAISTLIEKGWITPCSGWSSFSDSRKKEYIITDDGINALNAELNRLKELVENGEKLLGVSK